METTCANGISLGSNNPGHGAVVSKQPMRFRSSHVRLGAPVVTLLNQPSRCAVRPGSEIHQASATSLSAILGIPMSRMIATCSEIGGGKR